MCDQFDINYNLEVGSAFTYLKHLIARKLITLKMDEAIIVVARLYMENIRINLSKEANVDYISS
ncbi:TnsA endonuclease C-terminal domain-containing protein [Ureibacillus galli]|uniref:TnsA endonuclease C-terminal domain-containing protein n=1 Tax=Ureibacillus galli TaxID=2762222 RepID=UPI00296B3AA9|nr:TnsA endonuclease C-terminal domain-containing protein [Ureibacillus galli]